MQFLCSLPPYFSLSLSGLVNEHKLLKKKISETTFRQTYRKYNYFLQSQYKAASQIRVKAAAANQRQVDYNAGVETQWHKALKLDARQRKHRMMIDRGTQKTIWKLRFRNKTYAQLQEKKKHIVTTVIVMCHAFVNTVSSVAVCQLSKELSCNFSMT